MDTYENILEMKPTTRKTATVMLRARPEATTVKVVKLFSLGHSVPEISEKLGINQRTLEKKVAVIKEAYGVRTIAELVAFFLSNNLIKYKRRVA